MSTHFDDHDKSLEHEQALREELKDGGSAFPTYQQPQPEMSFVLAQSGLSRRDYFAGKAMTGFIMRGECGQGYAERVARMSFNIADAMIAESRRKS